MSSVSSRIGLRSGLGLSAAAAGRPSRTGTERVLSTPASDSISVVFPVPRSPLTRIFRLRRFESRYGPAGLAGTERVSRSTAARAFTSCAAALGSPTTRSRAACAAGPARVRQRTRLRAQGLGRAWA